MLIFFNIFSSLFDLFILYIFFNALLGKKKANIPHIVFFLCFILVEVLLMANTYINPASLSHYNKAITITLSIGTSFALTFLYNATLKQRLVTTIFFQVIAALSETILALLMYMIAPSFLTEETIFINCFMETMSKIFLFIFVIILIEFWQKKIKRVNVKYNILILLTPTISVVMGLLVPNNNTVTTDNMLFFYSICICLFILNIINFYLLKDLLDVTELRNKTIQLELSISYQREKYQQLNTSYRNTRRIVHDMKKHYNAIENMIVADNKDSLIDYIKNSISDIEKTYTKYNTGNLVIDTLLYNYSNLAESFRIQFNADLKVDSNKVPINEYDLCIILGNLLDNAVDACKQLPAQDAWININIQTTDSHVLIKTENKIPSIKENTKSSLLHGFGTENIRLACDKYKGLYDITESDGLYKTSIAIPIFKKDNSNIKYVSFLEKQ